MGNSMTPVPMRFILSRVSAFSRVKMGRVWIIRSPCCFAGSHGENRCAKEIGHLYQPICENKTSLRGRLGGAFLILPREKRSNQKKKTSTETSNKLAVTKCSFLFNNSMFLSVSWTSTFRRQQMSPPLNSPFFRGALSSSTVSQPLSLHSGRALFARSQQAGDFPEHQECWLAKGIKVESAKSRVFFLLTVDSQMSQRFLSPFKSLGKTQVPLFQGKKNRHFLEADRFMNWEMTVSRGP